MKGFGRTQIGFFFLLALASLWAPFVLAAKLTSVSVALSTIQKNAFANESIQFVTPSGVDSSTDTITATYAPGFTLTGLSLPQDVDLEVDNDSACDGPYTDKTLAGAAGVGVWGVARTGQVLTFTPPTNAAAGEIPPNTCVLIRIGTHAVIGSVGTGQVQNPSTAGNALISFGGGFGDAYGAGVSIVDAETVGVRARVGNVGGGGNPPGNPDVTPPLLLNLHVEAITETSARAVWNTDDAAASTWQWGITDVFEIGSGSDPTFLYAHTADLTQLHPGTRYGVRVSATDMVGNTASQVVYFTTLDHTAPFIIDPIIVDVTETTARVLWETDEPATSVVRYGKTLSYELGFIIDSTLLTEHAIPLAGLDPGTLYHVEVRSTDALGNEAVSRDLVFRTLEDTFPINVPLTVTPGLFKNTLTWPLPIEPDVVGVQLVVRLDRYPQNPFDGTILSSDLIGQFVHTGLVAGEPYYYAVFPYDARGQFASGSVGIGVPFGIIDVPTEPLPTPELPSTPVPPNPPSVLPPPQPPSTEVSPVTPPQTEVEPSGAFSLSLEDISLYVSGGKIQITPDNEGVFHLLGNRPFLLVLNSEAGQSSIASAVATFNGAKYLISKGVRSKVQDGRLVGPVTQNVYGYIANLTSSASGSPFIQVDIVFTDGSSQTIFVPLSIEADGRVRQEQPDGSFVFSKGAFVQIFVEQGDEWLLWDAATFFQTNPFFPDASGMIGWYVPNGIYDIRGEQTGYTDERTGPIRIEDHLLHPSLTFSLPPLPLFQLWTSDRPLAEKGRFTGLAISDGVRRAQQSVFVESVFPWLAALLTTLLVMGFATLFGALSLLPVLLGTLSGWWLVIFGKRTYGTVFLATTLDPVPGAKLSLYRIVDRERKLVETCTTGKHGHFRFRTPKKGTYEILVHKDHTQFPSVMLKDTKDIEDFHHLYHDELLQEDRQDLLVMDIPIDPLVDRRLYRTQKRWALFAAVVFGGASMVSLAALLVHPSLFSFVAMAASLLGLASRAHVVKVLFMEGKLFAQKPVPSP